jgi:hypothetical protein
MRDVYDPSHVLHDPVTEVQYGIAMPMHEVPVRVASIRAALLTDDNFSGRRGRTQQRCRTGGAAERSLYRGPARAGPGFPFCP